MVKYVRDKKGKVKYFEVTITGKTHLFTKTEFRDSMTRHNKRESKKKR